LANRTGYHHEKIRKHVYFLRATFAIDYIYPPMQIRDVLIPDANNSRKIYPPKTHLLYIPFIHGYTALNITKE